MNFCAVTSPHPCTPSPRSIHYTGERRRAERSEAGDEVSWSVPTFTLALALSAPERAGAGGREMKSA